MNRLSIVAFLLALGTLVWVFFNPAPSPNIEALEARIINIEEAVDKQGQAITAIVGFLQGKTETE